MESSSFCPCGSGRTYLLCCHPIHRSDGREAASAEDLMRSRYSAFALGLVDYLMVSWHHSTRPSVPVNPDGERQWLGLKILRHEQSGPDQAIVEFVARSRVGGQRADRQHEISRFVRERGQWFYVNGSTPG